MAINEETLETEVKKAESNVEKAAEVAGEKAGTEAKAEGLTEEEVNKRIEAARKQEKDKLYGEIGSLRDMVKELRDSAKAEKEAKEQAQQEAQAQAEAERKAKLSTEERMAEQLRTIEEKLIREASERQRLEDELDDERAQRQLDEYRQSLIKIAGDDIIPDLVQGKSKEDMDRSVAFAKSRYQELFSASKAKSEGNVAKNMPGSSNPDPDAMDEAELQGSIANFEIDMDRYSRDRVYRTEMDAKRREVTERVSSAYRRSVGR